MEWPEGKTAAELLRECIEKGSCEKRVFFAIADQIEKEIEEAKGSSKGYYIPAPVDENGELWRVGDRAVTNNRGETNITSLSWDGDEWIARCRWVGRDDEVSCFIRDCKRPKLEVLDADGVPIKKFDDVWMADGSFSFGGFVSEVSTSTVEVRWHDGHDDLRCDPKTLTHREPDTQEKIDADVTIGYLDYWKCRDIHCSDCPAREDWKTPSERYEKDGCKPNCSTAMILDLLRRQRELDARNGGAE